jgi:hypothetical protein
MVKGIAVSKLPGGGKLARPFAAKAGPAVAVAKAKNAAPAPAPKGRPANLADGRPPTKLPQMSAPDEEAPQAFKKGGAVKKKGK